MLSWLIRLFPSVADLHHRLMMLQDRNTTLAAQNTELRARVDELTAKVEGEKERLIGMLMSMGRFPGAPQPTSAKSSNVTDISSKRDQYLREVEQLQADAQEAMDNVDREIPNVLKEWNERVTEQHRLHMESLRKAFDDDIQDIVNRTTAS